MVMRPRIAILSNYPSDHRTFSGGVETATAGLLEGLEGYQNKFEFHVICFSGSIEKNISEQYKGFQFHFLKIPKAPLLRPRYPFNILNAYLKIGQINPDMVHCQDNMMLGLASVLRSFPRVFTVHGVKRHEAFKRTGWEFWSCLFDAMIEIYVHRKFDNFISISQYAKKVIGDKKKLFSIPNPVRSLFFKNNDSKEKNSKHILFVGVIAPLKRPADLLVAHADLRKIYSEIETVFCGDVEDQKYFARMQKVIVDRDIKGVKFVEHISQEKLADLLKDAIALVLPSAQENAPMVIAEAMASGVPVVASRVGGVSEMIKNHETGLLYNTGDVEALTKHLKNLLKNGFMRDRLGKSARSFAEANYSPKRVAEKTVTVYQYLLNMA